MRPEELTNAEKRDQLHLAIVQPLPAGIGSKPNCVPRAVVSSPAEPPTPAATSKAYTISQIPQPGC
jgi:hypothetical protein